MKTLFAITHINKSGMRQLTFANQGRNHYDTKELAQEKLDTMLINNSEALLTSFYGKKAYSSFEVRELRCYDHGDAQSIYLDNEA